MFYLVMLISITIVLAVKSLVHWNTTPFIEFFEFVDSLILSDYKVFLFVLIGCVVAAVAEPKFWDQ